MLREYGYDLSDYNDVMLRGAATHDAVLHKHMPLQMPPFTPENSRPEPSLLDGAYVQQFQHLDGRRLSQRSRPWPGAGSNTNEHNIGQHDQEVLPAQRRGVHDRYIRPIQASRRREFRGTWYVVRCLTSLCRSRWRRLRKRIRTQSIRLGQGRCVKISRVGRRVGVCKRESE